MAQKRTTIRLAEDVFTLLKREAVEKNSTIQALIDRCVRLYFHFPSPEKSPFPVQKKWGELSKLVSQAWRGGKAVEEIRKQRDKKY